MTAWWQGVPPADAIVDCGGARHRLRWAQGELSALDHTDIEGERVLAGLGGAPCVCVEVLDAWDRHAHDERVLVAATRGPGDPIARRAWGAPADEDDQMGWTSYGPLAPSLDVDSPDAPLMGLLALPGGLPERLVATVLAGCAARDVSPRLHAALYGRVASALANWLGLPDVELELTLGDAPSLSRDAGGVVHAELPLSWLVDVWSRGLATVMGRFCLSATSGDGRHWELRTVTPDFDAPETLRLTY